MNPLKEYKDFVRANLPAGMGYNSVISRYVVNGRNFVAYPEAEWYLRYIEIFGGVAPGPSVPGQVTGLVVTPGNTENSLTWSAPSDGGSPITDYIIEVDSGGGFTTISDGTSTATSFTHTGLTNGTNYTYRVSAVNSVGTGAASDTASGTPTSPVFDPEAGLTGGTNYSPGTVLLDGVQYSRLESTVIAFTVPSDWADDGVVFNSGGSNGCCVVIDTDGRVGVFNTLAGTSNYVLSNVGVLTSGDRVVAELNPGNVGPPRLFVAGVEETPATQNNTTFDGWAGSNDGGYLTQTPDGQESGSTPFPATSTWPTMQALPITTGTWGNLTIYRNQTITV